MSMRVRAAVLGASGYSGGELVRLLSAHPHIEPTFLGAKGSAGSTLGDVHPHLSSLTQGGWELQAMDPAAVAAEADLAFCALPHGASAEIVPALVGSGLTVVDLGGDFRLPADAYPQWYGFEHPAPEWLDKAVYGIPELFAGAIAGAKLIANPGCYATAVILSLAPLLRDGLVEPSAIRVDGKTGLSGAGRSVSETTLFSSTEDSIRPYRLPLHQHTPEMERGLELATGRAPSVLFAPHLVPAVRGVLTTSYASLAGEATTQILTDCLDAAYSGKPFIKVLPAGAMADSKRTRGTNLVELQAVSDPRTGTAVVVAAVDNLVKGAAGQAIQNANLAFGFPEEEGLPTLAVYP